MALVQTPIVVAAAFLLVTTASAQDSTKTKSAPKALQTRVWVNNSTKVYHCPGDQYYGKTVNGEFMEEAQARGFGNHGVGARGCNNANTPRRAPLPDTTDASKRMVWVNTESRIYHCPNASDWGATRRGKYLTESDAAAAGNKPAAARKCDNR